MDESRSVSNVGSPRPPRWVVIDGDIVREYADDEALRQDLDRSRFGPEARAAIEYCTKPPQWVTVEGSQHSEYADDDALMRSFETSEFREDVSDAIAYVRDSRLRERK